VLSIPPTTKLWYGGAVDLRLGFDGLYHFPTPTGSKLELTATEFAMILDGIDYPSARRFARYSRPES
jgi:hypothetical protein